jgi:hypothetical protein
VAWEPLDRESGLIVGEETLYILRFVDGDEILHRPPKLRRFITNSESSVMDQ